MADTFDFLVRDDGSDQSTLIGISDGSDGIGGGKGNDVSDDGDDGSVSGADALLIINDLGDEADVDDLFLGGGEAERGDDAFAPLKDDGASAASDDIEPVLIVIANQDFWAE